MGIPFEDVDRSPVEGSADAATFEHFFRQEQDDLFSALCLITASRQEAEDILQIAFMKVYERWHRVQVMERPDGFLYRIAMNEFRSRYRHAARAARRRLFAVAADDAFAEVDDRYSVLALLKPLIPQQRAAIVLTGLLGFSSEEAGRMLGLSASTVRVLANRARTQIRQTTKDPR